MDRSRSFAAGFLFALLLALLQWAIPAFGVPAYMLPTPLHVLQRTLDPESRLLFHFGITVVEALMGFALGGVLGFLLALLFVHIPPLETALYPWVVLLQTIPLVVIAPLFVLWFGNGWFSRALMAALFALFPILVNTTRGLRAIEPATLDLLQAYGATPWQLLRFVRLPSCLPFLFAGLRVGATMAVIGAIVAEMTGSSQGLGYLVTVSSYHLETDLTFAAAFAAAILGMSLYLMLVWVERRLIFWQKESDI